MAGYNLKDMLDGTILKNIAGGTTKADSNYTPADADAAKRNQDYADKKLGQKAAPKAASPLASPMTPYKPNAADAAARKQTAGKSKGGQ